MLRVSVLCLASAMVLVACERAETPAPVAGTAATPTPPVDPDTPALKPGQWRVVIDVDGSPPPRVQTMCVTAEQAARRQGLEATASMNCSERTVERVGSEVVIHAVCQVGGTERTYDHRARGDFASDYFIDSSVKLSPPDAEGRTEIKSRTHARWISECPQPTRPAPTR